MTRHALDRPTAAIPAFGSVAYWLWVIRCVAGLTCAAVLVFILRDAMAWIDRAKVVFPAVTGAPPSSLNATEMYAEHLLYAVVAIGITIGVSIATRMDG